MSYRTGRLSPTPPSRSLLLKPSGPFHLLPRSEHPPGPRPVRALHPLPGRPFPGPLLSSTAPSQRGPPRPPPGETPRRRHLMPAPGLTPRGRARLESFGRVSACSRAVLPPPGCRPPRAGPAGRARCPAHRARSVTTCRRATRPPRPLRRPRAPLPHGATWLAREHDCLELILPRGPVPSIRGDCHRPDPFGVSTEKAGGKRDMSLLAERWGAPC